MHLLLTKLIVFFSRLRFSTVNNCRIKQKVLLMAKITVVKTVNADCIIFKGLFFKAIAINTCVHVSKYMKITLLILVENEDIL